MRKNTSWESVISFRSINPSLLLLLAGSKLLICGVVLQKKYPPNQHITLQKKEVYAWWNFLAKSINICHTFVKYKNSCRFFILHFLQFYFITNEWPVLSQTRTWHWLEIKQSSTKWWIKNLYEFLYSKCMANFKAFCLFGVLFRWISLLFLKSEDKTGFFSAFHTTTNFLAIIGLDYFL